MTQEQYIKLGRWLTLSGFFTLMAGLYAWHLWFNPAPKHLMSLIIFFQLGPLMLPLFGLLNGKLYTHAWSMYIAIFYFVIGVWYVGHPDERIIGLYVIFTSLTFFLGTVFYTRFMGKKMQQLNAAATDTSADDEAKK